VEERPLAAHRYLRDTALALIGLNGRDGDGVHDVLHQRAARRDRSRAGVVPAASGRC
jgi:hypothetical protein